MERAATRRIRRGGWSWAFVLSSVLVAPACGDDSASPGDDGGTDAPVGEDGRVDAPTDTPVDAPGDTLVDAPGDAPVDTPSDAPTCAEGAILAPCLCDGAEHGDGSCCGGAWRADACGAPPVILWRDDIQGGESPWGFDGLGVEHPIDTEVFPDDANGANLSRVPEPLSGSGFALRHFATFDTGGSRSQAGIYSFANAAFEAQAKSAEGVWVAQEWYFPEAIGAGGDFAPWINLWDWHSTDAGGGNRWHTSPGLMLEEDGSMRVRWEWGGPANDINPTSADSTIALPVGEWFDIEMHYVWTTGTTTLSLWIDGELALEQSGVQTRVASHETVETYIKFYGSTQGGTPWSPTPSIRYTRNVRVAGERIWR